jgi:ABC-type Mn2+/Zn2+ transport system ATPase subunit
MTKHILNCRQASFGYGKKPVLAGVDLNIEKGAFVGILGHNGSGKTTMLKTILGLTPCLKGKLEHPAGSRPKFGYVPQKESLDPIYPLTAYNVAAMGTYRGFNLLGRLRESGEKKLVEHCLTECGAHSFADKIFSSLSGGQKQRVLIARALAAEPQILALDEPLAGIDITTQKAIIKLLQKLKSGLGLTVLMVSHRVQAERGLFTHIVWCDEGKAVMGRSEDMLKSSHAGEVFRSELTCSN